MMLSLAQKLKIKSRIFEDDVMTPYEKNIDGQNMTLKELSEHLEAISDKNDMMSYDRFKKLHQADLFIHSSVVELSQEDDRAFSKFLINKKKDKDLVNVK